jgi:hypothetical protein
MKQSIQTIRTKLQQKEVVPILKKYSHERQPKGKLKSFPHQKQQTTKHNKNIIENLAVNNIPAGTKHDNKTNKNNKLY